MVYTLFKYYGNSGNLDLRGEGGGNSLSVLQKSRKALPDRNSIFRVKDWIEMMS